MISCCWKASGRSGVLMSYKGIQGRTNLSIRRTAAITGLYKDKVNRFLYS
jgi:hypothetical protein